ncbi:fecR protein [Hyphomonas polymorpha PS728]|uniref:FecR protein n=2 Tax=Hyphomonas polymorpha TaxID=74319 RepID=A0A062VMN0_9PROT|nr:fecR protein [Hyphomonas polymorpha PS728]
MRVTLIEGSVNVLAAGEDTRLASGDQLRLSGQGRSLTRVDLGRALSWQSGMITFTDVTLAEAAAEMNRYSEAKIQIEGRVAEERLMFLFDEGTIGGVLGAFAEEARALWGDDCSTRDVWAVASRHNLPGKKGAWQPKSLVDYHPAYRSEGGSRGKANLLCRQLQKAAVHYAAARPPAEVSEMLAVGISGLARAHGWRAANDRPITAHNVWAALSHHDLGLPRAVRRLLRDHVLTGDAAWDQAAWLVFMEQLLPLLSPHPQGAEAEIADFCGFVAEQKADPADPERRSTKQVQFDELTLRLGSIHSVKGKSVDGILVVESEVWKGSRADERCIDLTTVLPRAFGVTDEIFTGVKLTAATNVFVGVTRPRELLGLALRKSEAMNLVGPATHQGWKIVDLVENAARLA